MIDLANEFYFDTEYQATLATLVYNDQLEYDTLIELAKIHVPNDLGYYHNPMIIRLYLLNWAIGGHGIDYNYDHEIEFINMGDTYIQTIIVDPETGELAITSLGDYIESLPQILTGLAGCYMPDNTHYLAKTDDMVEAFKNSCIDYFILDDDLSEDELSIEDLRDEIDKLVEIAKEHNRKSISYIRNSHSVELILNGSKWP